MCQKETIKNFKGMAGESQKAAVFNVKLLQGKPHRGLTSAGAPVYAS
jgi:hypothetical protein